MQSLLTVCSLLSLALAIQASEVAIRLTSESMVFRAIDEENISLLQQLLVQGVPKDTLDSEGRSFLTYALEKKYYAQAEALIELGVPIHLASRLGYSPLHLAAQNGAIDLLKKLVLMGAEVNVRGSSGNLTPLHFASCLIGDENTSEVEGKAQCAEFLVTNGAYINAQDILQNTPLHRACYHGLPNVVDILLAKGADLKMQNEQTMTPLHCTAERKLFEQSNTLNFEGRGKCARALLAKGAAPDVQTYAQKTPLHIAASTGAIDVMRELLAAGANKECKDDDDNTPLHLAVNYRAIESVVALLLAEVDLEAKNNKEETPLYVALKNATDDDAAEVRLLILSGADTSSLDDKTLSGLVRKNRFSSERALKEVLINPLPEAVTSIAENSSENTPRCRTTDALTKLIIGAARTNNVKFLDRLLKKKLPYWGVDTDGKTAAYYAAMANNLACFNLLMYEQRENEKSAQYSMDFVGDIVSWLCLFADVESLQVFREKNKVQVRSYQSPRGSYLLHTVVKGKIDSEKKKKMVQYLLNEGADIDSMDSKGRTVLSHCCESNDVEVVDLLTSRGANITSSSGDFSYNNDERGFCDSDVSPLHVAALYGHSRCVQLLLSKKAAVDMRSNKGLSPLMYAVIGSSDEDSSCIMSLIGAHASLNARDRMGRTALHIAARFHLCKKLGVLIEKGARVNSKDTNRRTPLHLVFHCESISGRQLPSVLACIKLLIAHGADVNSPDLRKRSPLFMALAMTPAELYKAFRPAWEKIPDLSSPIQILRTETLKPFQLEVLKELLKGPCFLFGLDITGDSPFSFILRIEWSKTQLEEKAFKMLVESSTHEELKKAVSKCLPLKTSRSSNYYIESEGEMFLLEDVDPDRSIVVKHEALEKLALLPKKK